MKKYLWAAAHQLTPEQSKELEGTVLFLSELNSELHNLLCNVQKDANLESLAEELISLCEKEELVLVQPAGSPKFQFILGKYIWEQPNYHQPGSPTLTPRIEVLYSYSERISEDIPQQDGTVKKISIFKHSGFI